MSSTGVSWQTTTSSAEETEALGAKLGANIRGGEVIGLVSDLGGGKTTFVRGLVQGMGSVDKVSSPTFTISKLYQTGELDVHHFDFYRLPEAGIMADELAEIAGDPKCVVLIEWGDVVDHVLPESRLTVGITHTPEGKRAFDFTAAPAMAYLLEGIKA